MATMNGSEGMDDVERLQRLISEGIESGVSERSLEDCLQVARARVAEAAPQAGAQPGADP